MLTHAVRRDFIDQWFKRVAHPIDDVAEVAVGLGVLGRETRDLVKINIGVGT